jgi:hypothetical protein
MYNIPEMYKKESIINKKKFIPKKETSYNKKKIRENLKKIKLKYQIDRDIPSLINETYNIQVIMYLEVELKSMKHRTYINEVFQKLLKGYVIIKYICDDKVSLGYGYKRLNKYDVKDVLLENSFVTEEFQEVFFFDNYLLYEKYLNFEKIKNKTNKLEFYLENMVKAYIISNKNIVKNYSDILESNIFYNIKPTMKIYKTLENLVDNHTKVKAKKTTTEKIELNKKITKLNKELEDLLNE